MEQVLPPINAITSIIKKETSIFYEIKLIKHRVWPLDSIRYVQGFSPMEMRGVAVSLLNGPTCVQVAGIFLVGFI